MVIQLIIQLPVRMISQLPVTGGFQLMITDTQSAVGHQETKVGAIGFMIAGMIRARVLIVLKITVIT